jgi:Homeodomain-like domain
MAKRSLVTLSEDERAHLLALTKKGMVAARKLTRAHILLQADAGVVDTAIATALHVGTATVERIRKRFVEESLEAALSERPRPGGDASWRASKKHCSSRWPVVHPPMSGHAGPGNYWPTNWLN